jgi:glutathione S-transferase
MAEGLRRLDAHAPEPAEGAPTLDAIAAVVALDYVRFRFPQAGWVPEVPRLDRLRHATATRSSVELSRPRG